MSGANSTDSKTLPTSAAVVIIGGGVMGLAAAYELARAGVRDVVLLEQGALGEGSTCKAAGGVRAQFSDELNIALGARSLDTFERFGELFDTDIDLHRSGYLFLLDSDEAVTRFEASAKLQREQGLESHLITVAEAKKKSPYINTDGLLAAAWTPRDGHCTPESVVSGFARAARSHGARLITGCAATGIDVVGEQIRAVETARGRIETDTVICAAGAWSARVGEWAGVSLPVEPLRRELVITEPVPGRPDDTPFTIDQSTTMYFHNEGKGLLIGMSSATETPGFKTKQSPDFLGDLAEAMMHRVPDLAEVGFASGWAGLYENTPDHNALIGESDEVGRFLYATGFSGHGFLQGPAVGEVLRDLYLDVSPFVDVSSMSVDRFTGSDLRPEFNIV